MKRRASFENRMAASYRFSEKNKPKRVPVAERLKAYLIAIFRKGLRYYTINFDRLARTFSCTRRTVENAVAVLRGGDAFCFQKIRVGRSFAVQVSDRNPSIKEVFSLKRKKEIQNNTASRPDFSKNISGWASKPPPKKILALAAFLARNILGKLHRAESRTMFRFAHAYNFATDALHAGFGRDEIADAYRYALRSVDDDLAHLPRETRWEPSSLIRLARRRLADGMNAAERVRLRAAALRKAKRADAAPVELVAFEAKPASPSKTAANSFFGELAALVAQHAAP